MDDKELSRTIPTEIRRILRQEVNYGCPVESCGSPYLSYHHFDPPWHVENHHNPNGMIALCLHHHKAADNGAFTSNQLKNLKNNPFLSKDDILSGQLSWKRENILFDVGGNYYLGASQIYLRKDEQMIWLEHDEKGNIMINLNIKDKEGNLIFTMRNNDWIISTSLQDIESPPAMKIVKLKDGEKKVRLTIELKSYNITDFQTNYKNLIEKKLLDYILKLLPKDEIVICKVRGLLQFPFQIHLKDGETIMRNVIGPFTINTLFKLEENATMKEISLSQNLTIGNGVLIQ